MDESPAAGVRKETQAPNEICGLFIDITVTDVPNKSESLEFDKDKDSCFSELRVHCPNPLSLQLNASISSQIDEILKEIPNSSNTGMKNIVVLRLPTKHCFFNPIEMVWANIKGYVAKNNHACTIKDTLRLTHEGVNSVSKMLCGVSFKKFLL